MYDIDNTVSYTIYRYHFKENEWHVFKNLSSHEELVEYLATQYRYANVWIDAPYIGIGCVIEKEILDDSFYYWFCMNMNEVSIGREMMIVDSNNKIVNPRIYEDEAEKRFHIKDAQKPTKRHYWHRYYRIEPYRSRKLVKKTEYHETGIRNKKNWFHNYKEDHIPEYKEFVRHNGKVPNVWEPKPWVDSGRSWKDTTKCKHQYLVIELPRLSRC